MIFMHTWRQVLSGEKTVTRRLVNRGDFARNFWGTALGDDLRIGMAGDNNRIGRVFCQSRLKWQVYETYAVQPGQGKKAVGRIRITGIRQEPLQNLDGFDAFCEGIEGVRNVVDRATLTPLQYPSSYGYWCNDDYDAFNESEDQAAIATYAALWDTIHTKPGTRWADNPSVFVLSCELVERRDNALA